MANTSPLVTKKLVTKFTVNAAVAGTVLDAGYLPRGVTVLGASVYTSALGASVTAKLGDSSDDDRFVAAASVATATKLSLTDTVAGGVGYVVPAQTKVLVTLAGATTAATNQTVLVVVEYAETY